MKQRQVIVSKDLRPIPNEYEAADIPGAYVTGIVALGPWKMLMAVYGLNTSGDNDGLFVLNLDPF